METQSKHAERFALFKNHFNVTSIVDSAKQGGGNRGVIAIFFQDEQYPARAELYAQVCVDALNQEAARRAK